SDGQVIGRQEFIATARVVARGGLAALNSRRRTDFSEGSGWHCGQSPDQKIGRARGSSIWRRLRARFLLRRRSLRVGGCEVFAVVVLRLGRSLGGGCSFGLAQGCTGGSGLSLCLNRLCHRAFAHIGTRIVVFGTEEVSEERPNAARARRS